MPRRLMLSAAVLATTVATVTSALMTSPADATIAGTNTSRTVSAAAARSALSAVPLASTAGTPAPTMRLVRSTYFRTAAAVTTPPAVNARAWAVADMDTGRIIAAHDRHDELPQASTIKLLTAVTAAETVAAFPAHRVSRSEAHPEYCTCAGLEVGARYSRTALMAGMLLPSGNDAAEALAGSHPQGRAAFIAAMNDKAVALGAKHTAVVTPSGLTAVGAHSSAYDLLVFLRAALASPVVEPILELPSYDLGPVRGTTHTVFQATDYVNTYPGALGKAGYTTPAKNTLVVTTPIGGRHIGVATLGAPGGYSTSGARALTEWAAKNFPALRAIGRLPAVPTT